MFASFSFTRCIYLFLLVFLLCQCTKTAQTRESETASTQKQYALSFHEYLTLANSESGSVKQDLRMKAAAKAIGEGRLKQASVILAQTEASSALQLRQKAILEAHLDIQGGRIEAGKRKLSAVQDQDDLSEDYKAQFHLSWAEAWQKTGQMVEAIHARIHADTFMTDPNSLQENRLALWSNLMRLPQSSLANLQEQTPGDGVLKGWTELALIPFHHANDGSNLAGALLQWKQDFPNHPAHYFLPNIVDKTMQGAPHRIALLLPLTGSLSGPGGAIRDGFMLASKQVPFGEDLNIHVYDTALKPAAELYQEAIKAGADFVIGPLSKQDVASVAALDHPVPTLLLNEVEQDAGHNVYQFGLSSTYEAQQVAKKAGKQGFTRALVLAPDNWGKETVTAFTRQWEAQGGEVAGSFFYNKGPDLARGISDVLQVSASEARVKQLKQILGKNVEVRLSRRMDIDMIFLLGYPSFARQIMPLLRYYYAGNIPVYATSTVYAGIPDSMRDRDLNGLVFCDMPQVFSPLAIKKNWPEQLNSYNRLFALGMDSFAFISRLNQWKIFPSLAANDGLLSLKPSGKITRDLAWGRFKNGQVHLLEKG